MASRQPRRFQADGHGTQHQRKREPLGGGGKYLYRRDRCRQKPCDIVSQTIAAEQRNKRIELISGPAAGQQQGAPGPPIAAAPPCNPEYFPPEDQRRAYPRRRAQRIAGDIQQAGRTCGIEELQHLDGCREPGAQHHGRQRRRGARQPAGENQDSRHSQRKIEQDVDTCIAPREAIDFRRPCVQQDQQRAGSVRPKSKWKGYNEP